MLKQKTTEVRDTRRRAYETTTPTPLTALSFATLRTVS